MNCRVSRGTWPSGHWGASFGVSCNNDSQTESFFIDCDHHDRPVLPKSLYKAGLSLNTVHNFGFPTSKLARMARFRRLYLLAGSTDEVCDCLPPRLTIDILLWFHGLYRLYWQSYWSHKVALPSCCFSSSGVKIVVPFFNMNLMWTLANSHHGDPLLDTNGCLVCWQHAQRSVLFPVSLWRYLVISYENWL